MQVIVEVLGRVYVLKLSQGKIVETDDADPGPEPEDFSHVPMDPHGTLSCQVERAETPSASIHATDPVARRFGFGCQEPGE